MKLSKLKIKTLRTDPAGEEALNAKLLIRANYIYKEMSGVYAYLPLGFRVIEKIKGIIREEMNRVDGVELLMTSLQPKDAWESTTRWNDDVVDIWFKTKLKNNTEIGLAWSHEEAIMKMISTKYNSYKDFPISIYQFQTKLRNEVRAKSGIMRCREFIMKDLYSMHTSEKDLLEYYEKVSIAYNKIFERLGIGTITFKTFASGGAFTKYSHEFQTICISGEDYLYLDETKNIAINEEVLKEAIEEFSLDKSKLKKVKSAEVGNIFNFGTQKAEDMNILYTDENGDEKHVYLASYGIGVSRLMGVISEISSDEKGLVWDESIAPYKYYLISIGDQAKTFAEKIYRDNEELVLYDDRDVQVGEKFNDADLLGIPYRIVISDKTLQNNNIEIKNRKTSEIFEVQINEFISSIN